MHHIRSCLGLKQMIGRNEATTTVQQEADAARSLLKCDRF